MKINKKLLTGILLTATTVATMTGVGVALASCTQQQTGPQQKKGYITFWSTSKWISRATKSYVITLTKKSIYDINGFIQSYDPDTIYTLDDKFINGLMNVKDEWNIYFYHSDYGPYGSWKWYTFVEYYNVVYKKVPQPKI